MDDEGEKLLGGRREDKRRRAQLLAAALGVVVMASLVVHGLSSGGSAPSATVEPAPPDARSSASPEPFEGATSPYTGPTIFGLSVPVGQGRSASAVIDTIKQEYGSLPIARIFSPTLPPQHWSDDRTLAALGSGSSVVYSFKGSPSQVVAGAYDVLIENFLKSKPPSVRAWLVYYHEPEDDIAKGLFTSEQFVAATTHLAPIVRAFGAYPTTILQEYTLASRSGRDWHDYYSPAIDVLGWDAYNVDASAKTPSYKPATSFVDPVVAVARETGKPFGWGEFGSPCIEADPDCSRRAIWLAEVSTAMRSSGAQFAMYWNRASAATDGPDYTLNDGPSKRSYRKFISP